MPLARHDMLMVIQAAYPNYVSTHMPLARHDEVRVVFINGVRVSTHMPLARHDLHIYLDSILTNVSTHMPLARHDKTGTVRISRSRGFYSHASCEA